MSSINTISIDQLARLMGIPKCPALIDVRIEDDFEADPRLIPGSMRRPFKEAPDWAHKFDGRWAACLLKSAQIIWCASCGNTRMCRRT